MQVTTLLKIRRSSIIIILVLFSVTGNAQNHPIIRLGAGENTQVAILDELVIHYMAGATYGYDMYDTEKLMNDGEHIANFYTFPLTVQLPKLAVSGFPIEAIAVPEIHVPLGFEIKISGEWKICLMEKNNCPDNTRILLVDAVMDTMFVLDENEPVVFDFLTTDDPDRFSLIIENMTLVVIESTMKIPKNDHLPLKIYNFEEMVFVENIGSTQISGKLRLLSLNGSTLFEQFTEIYPTQKLTIPGISGVTVLVFENNEQNVFSKKLLIR